jgi:predicted PurR-regulated permease PerM
MIERLPRHWRNVALLVLALLVLWFCWSIRTVINPLLLGYLFAYILHPAVRKLEGRGFSRRTAVLLIFLAGFLAAGVITFGIGIQTKNLVRDVVTDEGVREKISTQFEELRARLDQRFPELIPEKDEMPDMKGIFEWVRDYFDSHREAAQQAGAATVVGAKSVFELAGDLFHVLLGIGGLFLLVPLYTYYMLFELGRVHAWVQKYIPRMERERMTRVASQIGDVLSSFFRGRLVVCLLKGVVVAIGLFAVGVPYAFLFGMLGGFLSIIPFVGPMIAFAGAFLVGVIDHGVVGSAWRTGVVFGVAEILEGYVFIPRIMGESLGLHEVVVLFALIAGGASLGMFGVLISLPMAATIAILFREFVVPALTAWVEEERSPPAAPPNPPAPRL